MQFELRFYNVAQGRGNDMKARLLNDLCHLFESNNVPMAGAWFAEAGTHLPRFVYLVTHSNQDTADAAWERFYSDPGWTEARARTNAGSELVEGGEVVIGRPILALAATNEIVAEKPKDELVMLTLEPGTFPQAIRTLSESILPELERSGGGLLGAMNVTSGLPLVTLVLVLRYANRDQRAAFGSDIESMSEFRGSTCFRSMQRLPLEPIEGCLVQPGLQSIVNTTRLAE